MEQESGRGVDVGEGRSQRWFVVGESWGRKQCDIYIHTHINECVHICAIKKKLNLIIIINKIK